MEKNLAKSRLKALANILIEKNLYKEADKILSIADSIDSYAIKKQADGGLFTVPTALWIIGILGAGAATVSGTMKINEDARSILDDLTSDFEAQDMETLYQEWRKKLAEEDIIDGLGTFPAKHHMGGAFMRKYVDQKWNNKSKMTESEFQDKFEHYYGESAAGILQYGLDNEVGWVESFNTIVDYWKVQEGARKEGKDPKTDTPSWYEDDDSGDNSEEKPSSNTSSGGSSGSGSHNEVEGEAFVASEWKMDGNGNLVRRKPKSKKEDSNDPDEKGLTWPSKEQQGSSKKQTLTWSSSGDPSVLKVGSKGPAVRRMQELLLKVDENALPRYGADGDFGRETRKAVIKFKTKAKNEGNWDEGITSEVDSEAMRVLSEYASYSDPGINRLHPTLISDSGVSSDSAENLPVNPFGPSKKKATV